MPVTLPDWTTLTTPEKLDLIRQIEGSFVPGSADIDAKMDQIGEIWDSIPASELTISDELLAELDKSHDEYLRDPSLARPWEEVLEELRQRHVRNQSTTAGAD